MSISDTRFVYCAVQKDTTEIPEANFRTLYKNKILHSIQYLRQRHGIVGRKPKYEFFPSRAHCKDANALISNIGDKISDTRVIITDLSFDDKKTLSHRSPFLLLNILEPKKAGWIDPQESLRTAIFRAPIQFSPFLTHDYFTELYIASTIAPVRRFIQHHGHQALFDQKAAFFLRSQIMPPVFGPYSPKSRYACFVNALRSKNDEYDPEQLDRAVELWDDFVTQDLKNFILGPDEVLQDLRLLPKKGGQIPARVSLPHNSRPCPYACLLAVQKRRPKPTSERTKLANTLKKPPSTDKTQNKIYYFLPHDQHQNLQKKVEDEKLELFRFYVDGGV